MTAQCKKTITISCKCQVRCRRSQNKMTASKKHIRIWSISNDVQHDQFDAIRRSGHFCFKYLKEAKQYKHFNTFWASLLVIRFRQLRLIYRNATQKVVGISKKRYMFKNINGKQLAIIRILEFIFIFYLSVY